MPSVASHGAVPARAVDVHAHTMSGASSAVDGAVYAPMNAPVDDYLTHLDALGVDRGVLVNPSVYGTDHQVLLAALRAQPDRLRGVAVLYPDGAGRLDADEAARLDAGGVRGCRVQDRFGGGVPAAQLPAVEAAVRPLGWHVEVWTDPVAHRGPILDALAHGRVLLDHLGWLPAPPAGEPDPAVPVLRELLAAGDCWVTLSGAYRLAPGQAEGTAAHAVLPRVHAVLEAAPDRVVWGTDWPYVAPPGPVPTAADHRAVLDAWLPDPDLRRAVLVDNPSRLYRWDETPVTGPPPNG